MTMPACVSYHLNHTKAVLYTCVKNPTLPQTFRLRYGYRKPFLFNLIVILSEHRELICVGPLYYSPHGLCLNFK